MTHVSTSPRFHPGRSDFPSPVGDHSFSLYSLPVEFIGLSACSHTPMLHAVCCILRSYRADAYSWTQCSIGRFVYNPPCAESSFAFQRCYLFQEWFETILRWHYPAFIATTNSCAKPVVSTRLHFLGFVRVVFAGCYKPLLTSGPSQRYLH